MNPTERDARIAYLESEIERAEGPCGFAVEWQVDRWRDELKKFRRERDTGQAEACVAREHDSIRARQGAERLGREERFRESDFRTDAPRGELTVYAEILP